MFSLAEIAKTCKGKLINCKDDSLLIDAFCTDTRKIRQTSNTLFVALSGPRYDGNQFTKIAYEAGIRFFLVNKIPALEDKNATFIHVKNTTQAFQKLAALHLKKVAIPVIAVTGSNGKTIVKEWLYQTLCQAYRIIRNPKSYNSQIGVPISVLQTRPYHNLGIFEAGISEMGEMTNLAKILKPAYGVFTNIGDAHSTGFENIKAKIIEKLHLFERCKSLVYCRDHSLLHQTIGEWKKDKKIKLIDWSFKSEQASLSIYQIEESRKGKRLRAIFNNKIVEIDLPFKDPTSIENAIHCWLMALVLGVKNESIKTQLLGLAPVDMRLKQTQGINNTQLIHDYYNSDLTSIEIAIDFLSRQQTFENSTLILSDIEQNDLPAAKLYRKVAKLIKERKINRFIGIGRQLSKMHFVFKQPHMHFYASTDDFIQHFPNFQWQNESILLKGARSFEFEKIARLLQKQKHQTYLEINLNHVENNLNYFRTLIKKETKIMAMVKAYAYGSGTNEIAKLLQYNHVDYLAVAYADEGVNLRKAGIHLPIMVLNTKVEDLDILMENNLEPVAFSLEQLKQIIDFKQHNFEIELPIHIEFDTGMHRLGFVQEELDELIALLQTEQNISIKSVFSHLAASESTKEADILFTSNQISSFKKIGNTLEKKLGYSILKHLANTGGILFHPKSQFDMVRLGIGLYGISPGKKDNNLIPANKLRSYISQIKEVKAHEGVSYGLHSTSTKERKIAIVAIGYADGVNRKLSQGVGYFYVHGKEAPIVGNVCMDMTMIDVSDITCNAGDEVEIFGLHPTIEEIADKIDTIPYEVLTNISERVKRLFVHE